MEIFIKYVITSLIVIYILQMVVVLISFATGDFKTKKEVILNIIPFYWVHILFGYVKDEWDNLD